MSAERGCGASAKEGARDTFGEAAREELGPEGAGRSSPVTPRHLQDAGQGPDRPAPTIAEWLEIILRDDASDTWQHAGHKRRALERAARRLRASAHPEQSARVESRSIRDPWCDDLADEPAQSQPREGTRVETPMFKMLAERLQPGPTKEAALRLALALRDDPAIGSEELARDIQTVLSRIADGSLEPAQSQPRDG